MQEVSSLLLDLENLIDQSANEAGLTDQEVAANQLQIDSILQSIDRLAEATAFGDRKLLNGDFDFTTANVTAADLANVQVNAAKLAAGASRQVTVTRLAESEVANINTVLSGTDGGGVANGTLKGTTTIQIRGNFGAELLSFASGTSQAAMVTAVNDRSELTGVTASAFNGADGASPGIVSFSSTGYGADTFVAVSILENDGVAIDIVPPDTERDYGVDGTFTINGANAIVDGLDVSVRAGDLSTDLTLSEAFGGDPTAPTSTSFDITGGGAVFSISPTVGLSGQESIGIGEVSSARLGNNAVGFLASLRSGLANDLASKNFATAQRIVRSAINEVASLRGRLGGFQKDTLVRTINSLQVARENVTAAESAIRDADFASETSNLTRAQILVSSSTSVLRVANTQPQNALALLG